MTNTGAPSALDFVAPASSECCCDAVGVTRLELLPFNSTQAKTFHFTPLAEIQIPQTISHVPERRTILWGKRTFGASWAM
jgi:hypothetical protein